MAEINKDWATMRDAVQRLTDGFNFGTQELIQALGEKRVGRKFTEKGWETRFNRALYEVEVYYASRLAPGQLQGKSTTFESAVESLCLEHPEFVDSIETSTKNIDKYYTRFSLFRNMVNRVFGASITDIPVPARG
jgi:hypothetical protein